MSISILRQLSIPILWLGLGALASGHDFWLEPTDWRVRADRPLGVKLVLGHPSDPEPYGRNPRLIERFFASDGAREIDIGGRPGRNPAGVVRLPDASTWVVAYRSRPSQVTLPAQKFEAYLKEEGLERIVELRRVSGQEERDGREQFSRCAKLLLAADQEPSPARTADHPWLAPLGLTLELVTEKDHRALQPGDSLPVRLFYLERPLADALVEAMPLNGDDFKSSARTDADGRVTLDLPTAGGWLVTCVHMDRLPEETGAEWESYWASLTLRIPVRETSR